MNVFVIFSCIVVALIIFINFWGYLVLSQEMDELRDKLKYCIRHLGEQFTQIQINKSSLELCQERIRELDREIERLLKEVNDDYRSLPARMTAAEKETKLLFIKTDNLYQHIPKKVGRPKKN